MAKRKRSADSAPVAAPPVSPKQIKPKHKRKPKAKSNQTQADNAASPAKLAPHFPLPAASAFDEVVPSSGGGAEVNSSADSSSVGTEVESEEGSLPGGKVKSKSKKKRGKSGKTAAVTEEQAVVDGKAAGGTAVMGIEEGEGNQSPKGGKRKKRKKAQTTVSGKGEDSLASPEPRTPPPMRRPGSILKNRPSTCPKSVRFRKKIASTVGYAWSKKEYDRTPCYNLKLTYYCAVCEVELPVERLFCGGCVAFDLCDGCFEEAALSHEHGMELMRWHIPRTSELFQFVMDPNEDQGYSAVEFELQGQVGIRQAVKELLETRKRAEETRHEAEAQRSSESKAKTKRRKKKLRGNTKPDAAVMGSPEQRKPAAKKKTGSKQVEPTEAVISTRKRKKKKRQSVEGEDKATHTPKDTPKDTFTASPKNAKHKQKSQDPVNAPGKKKKKEKPKQAHHADVVDEVGTPERTSDAPTTNQQGGHGQKRVKRKKRASSSKDGEETVKLASSGDNKAPPTNTEELNQDELPKKKRKKKRKLDEDVSEREKQEKPRVKRRQQTAQPPTAEPQEAAQTEAIPAIPKPAKKKNKTKKNKKSGRANFREPTDFGERIQTRAMTTSLEQ